MVDRPCPRRLRLGTVSARRRPRADAVATLSKAMKTGIHPEYVEAHVRCTCGNEFTTRSTQPEIHVEICSNCHPFYTGRQNGRTGGRVERFKRRAAKRASGSQNSTFQAEPLPDGVPAVPPTAVDVVQSDAPTGRRTLGAARRAGRRAGHPRGRDDARRLDLGGRGPQAAAGADRGPRPRPRGGRPRRDRGHVVPADLRPQAPPRAAPADRARRRRARRVDGDRLQGARHLGQRPAARGGAGDLGRHVGRDRRRRAARSPSACSSSSRSA